MILARTKWWSCWLSLYIIADFMLLKLSKFLMWFTFCKCIDFRSEEINLSKHLILAFILQYPIQCCSSTNFFFLYVIIHSVSLLYIYYSKGINMWNAEFLLINFKSLFITFPGYASHYILEIFSKMDHIVLKTYLEIKIVLSCWQTFPYGIYRKERLPIISMWHVLLSCHLLFA